MDPTAVDMHPAVRALAIVIFILIPIALVIIQRLPGLKKAFKEMKEEGRGMEDMFGLPGSRKRDVKVCPSCYRLNPPENQFCGFCGAELKYDQKGEKS